MAIGFNTIDNAINKAWASTKQVIMDSNRAIMNYGNTARARAYSAAGTRVKGSRMNQYWQDLGNSGYLQKKEAGTLTLSDRATQGFKDARSLLYNTDTGNYSASRVGIAGTAALGMTYGGYEMVTD